MGGAAHWKSGMAERAAALFSARAADLFAVVYGRAPASSGAAGAQLGDDDDEDGGGGGRGGRGRNGDDDSDDGDDLFKPTKRKSEAEAANDLEAVDGAYLCGIGLGGVSAAVLSQMHRCCSLHIPLTCLRPKSRTPLISPTSDFPLIFP